MNNNSDPKPFYNSYLNTLDFTDLEIKKVLDAIAINGLLENSIIIITSDHGQEFNENHLNYWGHASNYSKYQVQVPFIMHWPHTNPKVFQHLTTHYDVMPTLLSRIFDCKNVPKDYSIGKDLLVTNQQQTFILVGSYVNNGIIEKNRITTLHVSGETSITDLNLQPLVAEKPNLDVLKKSLLLLRYYYKKSD
jgi:membrane-anchored protein YejM (alkaline phosphatase superfamily)